MASGPGGERTLTEPSKPIRAREVWKWRNDTRSEDTDPRELSATENRNPWRATERRHDIAHISPTRQSGSGPKNGLLELLVGKNRNIRYMRGNWVFQRWQY